MFCDMCGDITMAAKVLQIIFPDGEKLEILICLECWRKIEKKSRKLKVAQLMQILFEDVFEDEKE